MIYLIVTIVVLTAIIGYLSFTLYRQKNEHENFLLRQAKEWNRILQQQKDDYTVLSVQAEADARTRYENWKRDEIASIRAQEKQLAKEQAELRLESWRSKETEDIRKTAIKQSKAVRTGKVAENLLPFLATFPYNSSDVRFIGSPIDFLIFAGLSDETEVSVVFAEVKTASSSLSARQRSIRDAVTSGRVKWEEIRL